jgi:small subunit ribosomal protein S6
MYEGLFLFPQAALSNMETASEHVKSLISRADGELVSFRKWDERRLAFEIKGNKRGLYFLAFFRCDPSNLMTLERDCNRSEQVLRSLVIRADHMNMEDIEAADGQTALADEIKLRAQQAVEQVDGAAATSSVTVGGQSGGADAPAESAKEAGEAAPAEAAAGDDATEEKTVTEETPAET